jgi:hypothetical protein
MMVYRGISYWNTYAEARDHSKLILGSRVVAYQRGYAVQLRVSGPYA